MAWNTWNTVMFAREKHNVLLSCTPQSIAVGLTDFPAPFGRFFLICAYPSIPCLNVG